MILALKGKKGDAEYKTTTYLHPSWRRRLALQILPVFFFAVIFSSLLALGCFWRNSRLQINIKTVSLRNVAPSCVLMARYNKPE